MKCPDPPVGARTAPGRGWTLAPCPQLRASTPFYLPLPPLHLQAARRRLHREEAQSGACAPPQGRPTRPPPISRGPSRPLPTTHTLIRVGGPTGPRCWPSLHTAETTALGRGRARHICHDRARSLLHRLSELAAALPLLALKLEIEKRVAWTSDDFVSVSMLRRHESIRCQEGVVGRGNKGLRVVGRFRCPSQVVRPRPPAQLLLAHELALLLGAAHSVRRLPRGSQGLCPDIGLPDHSSPSRLETESQLSQVRPLKRKKQSGHPTGSGVRSRESGVRSPGSGVRSPESGVRGPESGVRSPGSGVRGPARTTVGVSGA